MMEFHFLGNAHPTLKPEDFISNKSPIDFVVVGEGEVTLTELIKTHNAKKDLSQVKGIYYLKNGTPSFTGYRPLINDLSDLPLPNYNKIKMEYYLKPKLDLIRRILISGIPIYTGRGCPYLCEFCAANTIWKKGNKSYVRLRPVTEVIKEIKFLIEKYHIDSFYILDDTFTLNKKRVLEFCKEIKRLSIIWAAETRVNLIDEEMIIAMKDAGCIQLDFGIESSNQRILDSIKKGITIEQVRKAFKLCKKHNIRTLGNFLLNLPYEKKLDIKNTEKFMEELAADTYIFGITTPYIGTPIYEKYVNPKLKINEYSLYTDSRLAFQKRFKLASHSIDLNRVYDKWQKKFGFRFRDIIYTDNKYLRCILKSKRLLDYIIAFIYETFILYSMKYISSLKRD
jgi:radical SAM superfamily enzyme YgiQ (UPF0313 family)